MIRKRGGPPSKFERSPTQMRTSSLSGDSEVGGLGDEDLFRSSAFLERVLVPIQSRDIAQFKSPSGSEDSQIGGRPMEKRRFLICGVRPKLVVTMVIIGLAAIITTATLSFTIAANRFQSQTKNSLMLISNGRVNLIKAYLEDIERELQLFSNTQNVTAAISDFIQAIEEMKNGTTGPSSTVKAQLSGDVKTLYEQYVQGRPEMEKNELQRLGSSASDLVPKDWWAQALQQKLVFNQSLNAALVGGVAQYSRLKALHDPTFKSFLERKMFAALMIILDGTIIYSLPSRVDLFADVRSGPYARPWYPDIQGDGASPLATIANAQAKGEVSRSDFWLYFPAEMMSEAYFSYQPDKQQALVVVSISAQGLNQFMSKQEGPQGVNFVEWKTFDAYIQGKNDGRLRTESLFFPNASNEEKEEFFRLSAEYGSSSEDVLRMRTYNTSVLYQKSWTPAEDNSPLVDYRGVSVEVKLTDIDLRDSGGILDVQPWTLVCKIDRNEALGDLNDMRRNIAYVCVACLVFITACTVALSNLLLYPLIVIQRGMDHFGNGDFSYQIRVKTKDEMEKVSEAANDMAKALMTTTVSRSYVNNILQSMSEALLVFKIEQITQDGLLPGHGGKKKSGSGLDLNRSSFVKRLSLEDAEVKMVNSAACELFGYTEEELRMKSINMLFPDLKELEARHRRGLIGLETSIQHCSGKTVPVLFSGALMNDNEGGEVVVIIRDMTKIKSLEERHKFMREAFGRYVTDDVVEKLLDSPEGLKLGGERRRVTILMSDLRGFTALSSRLRPEQVVSFLNRYLERMLEIIHAHGGVVDEIIGDGMQVIFGAPISKFDDAQRAVACAVAMQAAMPEVNRLNQLDGLSEIEMGIGIHTGNAIAGNIGSLKRAKYGVVGNTVSIAAKIESYTTGNQILISHSTYREAKVAEVESASEVCLDEHGIGTLRLYNVTGVGGRYRQSFMKQADPLRDVNPPLAIKYFHITDKIVGRISEFAEIAKVSKMSLFLRYPGDPPTILTNLKISSVQLPDPMPSFCTRGPDGYVEVDLYVKVIKHEVGATGGSGRGFYVSITSLDREWRELLLQLAKPRHRKTVD